MSSPSHEAIMANVCVACRHTMRDHAWTNEDKCYCLVATCHCSDFHYRTRDSVEAYDRFRDDILSKARTPELQRTGFIPRSECTHTYPDNSTAWEAGFFGHMCNLCGENDL